ncbi:hypothetical protein NLG97_g480 [Lecanicillium saksenae]|uniref:Uncharacterized protein n=1 Tax=Lecanicillium saksenae TaxID=468837 RepID=A0ACC1R6I4_9HYPO|nr:hypothetical protein NLG97_g480 [Lecanicillium saksenae]
MDDIAVIGLGLRFPGDAASPESLWDILENGKSQWSEIPKDRLNINGYYHPGGERQGSISFKGAHFLKGDIAEFDAPFFSIAAADAQAIDPQQRLLLEVCYEALENAGCRKEDIDGSDTSVYVGSFVKDYEQICLRDPDWQPQYAATGNGIAIMANRISYYFNLHGPSMTIDTGCSGSLVSVHLAAQSLRSGESSLAIAAGAGLILTPNTIMPMTALNFLSPDGKCFTFDARANGYGRGEGVGVVILKRLSDAIRDNDTIRAVIRGTQVNQDGRTTGITLPSKDAQVANITAVYRSAGLSFSDTAYVECHGTGTQAGDWRELKAISETLGSVRTTDNPIFVGSVKPNIGHLEGAAGVAGLIKAVLMLERERIPPHINFETPNPDIDFKKWKVQVSRVPQSWPAHLKKRMSVNCFGFGGTNAHVILDGAADYLAAKQLMAHHSSSTTGANNSPLQNGSSHVMSQDPDESNWQIFCYSSNELSGVHRMVSQHSSMLNHAENMTADFLTNYAYTMGCRRSRLEWKSFYVSNSVSNLAIQMEESDHPVIRSTKQSSPKLCFLFCGQGSQWARMGLDLRSFPVFWNSLNSASWYLKTVLSAQFDLIEELSKNAAESLLSSTHISQPATTAIQIAILDLMRSLGVEPDFVVGHSSGEISAAFASGAISHEEAWEIAYYRGLAASTLGSKLPGFQGGMIAVSMGEEQAISYINTLSDPLEIACINSPSSVTLSGKRTAVEQASRDLTAKSIRHRVLAVDMAYHSRYMKRIEDEYVYNIGSISPSAGRKGVRMFSSVSGTEIQGSNLDASYWGKNMVSTVQFTSAMKSLMSATEDDPPSIFIEMGPSTVLRTVASDTLSTCVKPEQFLSALDKRQPGIASILNIVGSLWAAGYKINLKSAISRRFPQPRLKCLPNLPSYPWNHTKTYWHESHLSLANRFREYGRLDLIGAPTADSVPFEPRWRGFLRASELPWIQDHQVQKTVIYPAAGMISMVLEGARQMKKSFVNLAGYEIRNMRFDKAIVVPNTTHGVEVALNMRAETSAGNGSFPSYFTFSIYSKSLEKEWEKHSTGDLHFCSQSQNMDALFAAFSGQRHKVGATCTTTVSPRQLYEHLDTAGISYGPMFRNIVEVKKGTDSCVSKIRVPDTRSKMPANFEYPHLIHPATLDSMFQTLFALDPVPKIPYLLESIFVSDGLDLSGSKEFIGYAVAKKKHSNDAEAQISMCCTDRPSGQIIIKGLCFSGDLFASSAGASFLPNYRNLCTEMVWREYSDTAQVTSFKNAISLLCHKNPRLCILQVGGEPWLAKAALIAASEITVQPPRLGKYSLINQAQPDLAFDEIKLFPFEKHIDQLPDLTSLQSNYDLILVSDVAEDEFKAVESFLKPNGMIFQLKAADDSINAFENVTSSPDLDLGWNLAEIHTEWHKRTGAPIPELGGETWQPVMRKVLVQDSGWLMPSRVIILLPEDISKEVSTFELQFREHLASNYPSTVMFTKRLQDAARDAPIYSDALYISLLDISPASSIGGSIFTWAEAEFNAFHTLQSAAKKIVWVTRGANMNPTTPHLSPIIGLARTLMSEDLQKVFATFDLGGSSLLSEPRILNMLIGICRSVTDTALNGDAREVDFAEQDGALFVPRLETLQDLNNIIEKGENFDTFVERVFETDIIETGHQVALESSLHINYSSAGPLTPLHFEEILLGELDSQAVTVSFQSSILVSESEETRKWQSYDVIGRIASVGDDVYQYKRGDKVVALVPGGNGIRSTTQVDQTLVTSYKAGFAPSSFLCAYYALFEIGRICHGKTILIHAGAGVFGAAAIELALLTGATVFATVTGPHMDRQRSMLNHRGLEDDHILDGDNESYCSLVKLLTKGRGVDLVYNPTCRDLVLSVECVRRCGIITHFLSSTETGHPASIPGLPVTMVGFDVASLLTEDPVHATKMLHSVVDLIKDVSLDWMSGPHFERQFDISQLGDALAAGNESPHFGLVSITAQLSSEQSSSVRIREQNIPTPLKGSLSEDSTYILVGGLGGLGRSIAELLVANGAKHLAFLNRSGASPLAASDFLERLRELGVNAKAFAVDICDKSGLHCLFSATISTTMPPIAGVFHCAAVIKDAVFDNMTYENWNAGFRPKADGAYNLVEAVDAIGCDPFFIFLASSAGVIGTRGQANYAAGNSFLDALAKSLRMRGKRATSLDLGPILGAGMLAEDEVILDILRASGFYGIRHDDFLTIVKHAITGETTRGKKLPPQVILGVGTGGLMLQNQPADPYWSTTAIYSYLNIVDMPEPDLSAPSMSVGLGIKAELLACTEIDAAANIVCSGLSRMLAKSMNMAMEEIDPSRPPSAYGVDSLVAVGVRNWISGNCGVDISVFEIMSELTVFELSKVIAHSGRFGMRGGDKS